MRRGPLALLLWCCFLTRLFGQYSIGQITTDPIDHRWPSMNNAGDIVWSQKDGNGKWQVFKRPATGGSPTQITTGPQNHERPVISDNGTIVWFQYTSPGSVDSQVVGCGPNCQPGGATFTIEFSSQDAFSGNFRDAGPNFGIASNGTTISYYTFCCTSFVRRFNVSGVGRLSGDFLGRDYPDINSNNVIVYTDYIAGSIILATTSVPSPGVAVGLGQVPRLNDALDLVYIRNNQVLTQSGVGGQATVVASGTWADINNNKDVVFEQVTNGSSQIFLATSGYKLTIVPATNNQVTGVNRPLAQALAVQVTDSTGGPVSSIKINFSITGSPPSSVGQTLDITDSLTDSAGKASVRLTSGNQPGAYAVTAKCTDGNCSPNTVTFNATAQNILSLLSGMDQTAAKSSNLALPLTVKASDAAGIGNPNVKVAFVVTKAPPGAVGFAVTPPQTATGSAGAASALFKMGDQQGEYQITVSCPDNNCAPNTVVFRARTPILVTLLDPVPSLLTGPRVACDSALLSSAGAQVVGVAADGTAQIVLRITGNLPGEQLDLSFTDGDGDAAVDGGFLPDPLSCSSATALAPTTSVTADPALLGFAVYRTPIDFGRSGGRDDARSLRSLTIRVVSRGTAFFKDFAVQLVRPPVVLVHGTWSNPNTWLRFTPLNPLSPDPRFSVFPVDYSRTESLGVLLNARLILDQIISNTDRFKSLYNVAAVQSDLVAHSLGGIISRALAMTPGFLRDKNYLAGDVHKLITLDSTHLGTPLASNLIASNVVCKTLFGLFGNTIGQQIVDQAENSPLLLRLNSALAPIHIKAHAIVGHADPIQMSDAENAGATAAVKLACPSLLPGGSFRALYTSPSNPTGENDIIVGASSQAAASSGLAGPVPVSTFLSVIHSVAPISPQGPDVLNRDNNLQPASPTVGTVAEVVRLLNSSALSADFAPIKP